MSLKAPFEGSWWLSRLWGGFFIFSIATSPSLRDTSPQGEALPRPHTSHPYWTAHRCPLRLPLRGAGGSAVCGVAFLFSRLPPLRHSVTPLFRRGDQRSPSYHTQKSHNPLTFPCKPPQNIV